MVEAHGSFSSASCVKCKAVFSMEKLREEIMSNRDPKCPKCGNWVKPNIVFFGEQLPQRFFDEAEIDCNFSDLLICMGTSLEVYPFAGDQFGFEGYLVPKILYYLNRNSGCTQARHTKALDKL